MKRFWIAAGALAVTLATLALALVLGSVGFDVRRYLLHEGRLRRVMASQPNVESLTRGLAAEKATLIAAPSSSQEVERAIAAHGGIKSQEIRGKASRYAQLRLFRAGDMIYFVFFDAGGVMRDFTCISG